MSWRESWGQSPEFNCSAAAINISNMSQESVGMYRLQAEGLINIVLVSVLLWESALLGGIWAKERFYFTSWTRASGLLESQTLSLKQRKCVTSADYSTITRQLWSCDFFFNFFFWATAIRKVKSVKHDQQHTTRVFVICPHIGWVGSRAFGPVASWTESGPQPCSLWGNHRQQVGSASPPVNTTGNQIMTGHGLQGQWVYSGFIKDSRRRNTAAKDSKRVKRQKSNSVGGQYWLETGSSED